MEIPEMFRKVSIGLIVSLAMVSSAYSQDWAKKMFETHYHDFGTIARGAKAEFEFKFSNLYMEDVHVVSAHASCGCTSVRIENPNLKTYEKGAIVAHINSDSFFGKRGATITVTIDKPVYAEVQLQVAANIRTDVVFTPGSVQFGTIEQGTTWEQKVAVYYTGSANWQVLQVRSANPKITATAVPTGRQDGQVWYDLVVDVDKSIPAGYFRDHLTLITNDPQGVQIPVLVEGKVQSSISVSPTSLFLGVVQPGQQVTKQVVVQAGKPFKIVALECDDSHFKFDTTGEDAKTAKTVHVVPITFTAGKDGGKITKSIRIQTDLGVTLPTVSAHAIVADGAITQK
jgi:hypothetical protein